PDASVTGLSSKEVFLGRSVNVDASMIRITSCLLKTAQPDDPADDRIPARGIYRKNFTGITSPAKNATDRHGRTNLTCDRKPSDRRAPATKSIAFAVPGG